MVAHGRAGHIIYIYVAEYARHAEHVLALQIRAVRPAEHLHGQRVLAFAQVLGQVELGHIVGALRVAHVPAVEPYEGGGIDTAEVDIGAACLPALGQGEGAHVGTYGIDTVVLAAVVEAGTGLDEGRCIGMGIFHVAVDGPVIALHLPVGGNGNRVPRRHVVALLPEVQRTLRRFGHEVEAPRAVEAAVERTLRIGPRRGVVGRIGEHLPLRGVGHEGGRTRFLVFGKHGLVLPVRSLDFGFLDLFKREPRLGVFRVIRHEPQTAVAQGIHLAGLPLRGGKDAPSPVLSRRFEAELRVVPHSLLCGPLQQIVDGGIITAVVEMLRVESVLHHTAVQVEHLDRPILSAVVRIGRLAHDSGIVLARVAVAQHQIGMGCRADAVGQRHVETGFCRCGDAEPRGLVDGRLRFRRQPYAAVRPHHGRHLGAVGRDKQDGTVGCGLQLPQLRLVRAVVLPLLHTVALGADGPVAEGVDDAPRTGKFRERPILRGIRRVGRRHLQFPVRRHAEHLARAVKHAVEMTSHISVLRLSRHSRRKQQQEEQATNLLNLTRHHVFFIFII